MKRKTVTAGLVLGALMLCAPLPADAQSVVQENASPADGTPSDAHGIIQSSRARAVEQVLKSVRSTNPGLRTLAIEAAQNMPDRVMPIVELALTDEHPAVRFSALVTIGQLKLEGIANSAQAYVDDADMSVRAAALYALHRCGKKADLSPLASMVASQDPVVRGNAVMLLGMLGDASAVPVLVDAAGVKMHNVDHERESYIRLQTSEAVIKLLPINNAREIQYREDAVHALRAATYSPSYALRVTAITMLGRLKDVQSYHALISMFDEQLPTTEGLQHNPAELRLAIVEYALRIGRQIPNGGLELALQSADSPEPAVRVQATVPLGLMDAVRAARKLQQMLDDEQEVVRLSAATAILRSPVKAKSGGTQEKYLRPY